MDLHTVLMVIHFFAAAGIIALVLLQRGKGADAGAGFGAGASGTVFGARGAGTALSRATAILAGIFMLTSLSLTYVGSHTKAAPNTVLDRMSRRAPAQTGSGGSAPASATPAPATTSQAPPNVAPSSVAPANPTPAAPAAPVTPAPAGGTPASPAH